MLLFGELSSFNGIDSTGESPDSPAWGCGRRTGSADTASIWVR